MEDTAVLEKVDLIAGRSQKRNYSGTIIPPRWNKNSPVIEELIAEGGNNFYRYLRWQDLTKDPNILLLSSRHHYYYDHNELKWTTTLIILKKLNRIKFIDSFLHALHLVLSPGANFIGYFSDSDTQNGPGLFSMMYKGFIDFLDSRIDRKFTSEGVSGLLESNGFQVNDMTLINGLTYFRTRNIIRPDD
jgi:hypothetical protein